MELIKEIGAFAGLAAFLGLAVLALLSFSQGRDLRRLREWAGSAPERDTDRKDATSAAAAKRAEEMRSLEEARTAEQEAISEREERRRRREGGLPEQSRAERARQGLSGFGSKLAEPKYLAVLFVVVVIVAGGVAWLVTQGSDSTEGKDGKARTAKKAKPSEIEVTVLNGTATPGLAAEYGDKVEGKGFQLGAVTNSSAGFSESVVMFERGSAPEARRVATALGISQVRLMTPDIESVSGDAPVSVIVGEDNAATG